MQKNQVGANNLGRFSGLLSRLWFLVLALVVYRIGVYITLPGIDAVTLSEVMEQQGQQGGISAMINLFSGGAFEKMSVFMLGVMPYITASIVIQMLSVVYSPLEQLKKEGEAGRRKMTQYTRYMTIAFGVVQGIVYSIAIMNGGFVNAELVVIPPVLFVTLSTLTLVTGTMFLVWLGEQITERGIGNGISMIIFASILMGVPSSVAFLFETATTQGGAMWLLIVVFFLLVLAVIFAIVFIERGQRRITIQYARRQQGKMMSVGNQTNHLPLKLNMSGVIPAIFGSAFLSFVYTISAGLSKVNVPELTDADTGLWGSFSYYVSLTLNKLGFYGVKYFSMGQPAYLLLFAGLIIFFCFFYTAMQFNSKETAENLKRNGGFIPGIRPGIHTSQYLDRVLTRITLWGSLYITIICLLPEFFNGISPVQMYFGGTSILIAVVVVMDLVTQIQALLMSQQYESLMKKANISSALNGTPPNF